MDELFAEHQLILLPAAPVARLAAGADHGNTRKRLLRYTTPFSLAGVPAVTIPCRAGAMRRGIAAVGRRPWRPQKNLLSRVERVIIRIFEEGQ